MKKVLITGGAGFIGYHLSKRLAQEDYQVDLVDNLSRGSLDNELKDLLKNPNISFMKLDLLKSSEVNKLDNDYNYIYHFAAIIGVSNVLSKPYIVLSDNVLMLLNMISFANRQSSLERLLFTSTSEVYAGTLQNFSLPVPTPESTPLALTDLSHPRTSYMLSKIYGEALCHQSGIPFTIFRPHNVYGPRMGMAHVIPELLKKAHYAKNGSKLEVFSVKHCRTFCYINDFVEMINLASKQKNCEGKTLNIGNQSPEITIKTLSNYILKVTGKDLIIDPKPETPGSPPRRCPDMATTLKLTGYKPVFDIEKGVNLTYDWYKRNLFI